MPVTLQQIAADLRISTATVSRSLRDDPTIPAHTRAKIRATAEEMGYKTRARAIHRRKNSAPTPVRIEPKSHEMLGLLFPATSLDQLVRQRHDLNFVQIMQGVMGQAEELGRLVTVQAIPPHREAHLEKNPAVVPVVVREKTCQALILRGGFHPDDVAFLARQLPVVTVGRVFRNAPVDAVIPDSVGGVESIVAHLFELGHRRLAWMGGWVEATFTRDRLAGFVSGCSAQGLPIAGQHFFGPELCENVRLVHTAPLLQALCEGTTAVVCANDTLAARVISILEDAGFRVPHDVSVTGFDGGFLADSDRQVTSVDPRFTELGRAAVRLSLERLKHPDALPSILTVRSQLILGDTTAAPHQ